MSEEKEKLHFTLPLSGRIDSGNAAKVEDELRSAIKEGCEGGLVLDAAKLEYISSAGLRILLRLRKEHPELRLINVCSDVYEILDMTGFTEMIAVEKAFRELSLEGGVLIGRGANGAVYRIDEENVVKVYFNPDSLDEIRHEREMAKLALILGVPTAISYEIVRIGDYYGSVFELLNARSFSSILASEPEHFDLCVHEFTDLLKKIHSIEVPEGKLPDIKGSVLGWADYMRDYLEKDEADKLRELILAVPDRPNMLHGDYHPKNIMLQNDEVLVIDMDTLAVGDPIFELCSVYNAFIGFYEYDHNIVKEFQGFDYDTSVRFFKAALSEYLGTKCETKLREVENKARVLSYARLISRSIRHGGLETEKGREEIALWKSELVDLLKTADTLVADPNELEIEAERAKLPEVLEFIEERIAPLEPSARTKMQIAVAAEEIFVNIADYAYSPGRGGARLRIETDVETHEAVLTFSDSGRPYDPTARIDPDITLPVEERQPGGLGIFLTKNMMDSVSYEYRGGMNVLELRKKV